MSNRINLRLQPSATQPSLRSILRAVNSVTELTLEQGQLHARFASGICCPVFVAGESRIGPRLTLLKIRASDTRSGSRLVVLVNFGPGVRNVDPDEFRRLRMWLRLSPNNHSLASNT
ncbi:hypothetical protein EHN06_05665 [Marinobacter sp. NP-4(2019)]|uniref:hypothetical protein n=1 Tax=Marinobacter sp. NP-4(2019) TaxID=2488665 RepID=UPI000FC3E1BA|nr:hypothetical protein [Marinobacter sp. NP-4(2019)]AZT83072.1 hypothetical protein EHN06_05665 [Marinobacter sp. NP-4(2019)]